MSLFHVDIETFSELNINDVGVDVYAKHPSTRVIIGAWAYDGPVYTWDESRGPFDRFIRALKAARDDPEVTFVAWNTSFERKLFHHVLGVEIPLERWVDPMVIAYTLSFPGKLEAVGKIVKLPEEQQKLKRGRELIRWFSSPQTYKGARVRIRNHETNPHEWQEFVDYCARDVEAERAIHRRIEKWSPPAHEWEMWRLDQQINERGYPIDRRLVRAAHDLYGEVQAELQDEIRLRTGVSNPNSTAQISEWVRVRGYERPNLRKETVEKALRLDELDPALREVLELRLKAASSSPKKFAAIDRATSDDDRLRYTLQFAGAGRTWRWAGRIAQFQNIPRPEPYLESEEAMAAALDVLRQGDPDLLAMLYDDPMAVIVSCIRPSVAAPEGKTLGIADLSSIENVVLGWLARCERTLSEFRQGLDPYLAFGVHFYGESYEALKAEKDAGDKTRRTRMKPAKLGAGYRLGGGEERKDGTKTGLWGYAENLGVMISREEAHEGVRVYRQTYPAIVQFWYDLEREAKNVVRGSQSKARVGPLKIDKSGPFMRVHLPSGRCLYYCRPKIEQVRAPWGEMKATITYEGLDDNKNWYRISTHGGKLCIAKGTLVLTDFGWVPIEEVTSRMLVWDGEQWVSNDGALYKGAKPTIKAHGVRMTPEHEVLTDRGWKRASESERYNRAESRVPDCGRIRWQRWEEIPVVSPLHVRQHRCDAGNRAAKDEESRDCCVVRVQKGAIRLGEELDPREVSAPGLCGLEKHAGALRKPSARGLEELRGAGDLGLPSVDPVFRGVLGGHGGYLSARFDSRAGRQQSGVFPGELSMGHTEGAGEQQTRKHDYRHPGRKNDGFTSVPSLGCKRDYVALSNFSQVAGRRIVQSPRHEEQVYDLLNCGPNARFVVMDESGRPLIVHNCENVTQAVARDILAEGIKRAMKRGIDVIGHVHDEIIAELLKRGGHRVKDLIDCMVVSPKWAPDIPLAADGFESPFYRKD